MMLIENYLPPLLTEGFNTNVPAFFGGGLSLTGAQVVTSASASAFIVGANGATNPVLKINASTASVATGIEIQGAAAASGLAVRVISSGTNENLTIDAKGSGTITLGGVSTGNVVLARNTSVTGALSATSQVTVMSATAPAAGGTFMLKTGSTAALGLYVGSGAPTISAAQGSLYLRTDGSSTSTRLYVNTDGATTWTNVTTAA